jgi:hypothetical protein
MTPAGQECDLGAMRDVRTGAAHLESKGVG